MAVDAGLDGVEGDWELGFKSKQGQRAGVPTPQKQ